VEPIEGAILAAGRGERLRTRHSDLPKPLVALDGETLLARQFRLMTEAGAAAVTAVVNSETASRIERDRIALPAGLRLFVRDTANSMETLFELGHHLAAEHFLAATVDAVVGPGEMARFLRRAIELTSGAAPSADGVLAVVRWRGDERPLFVEIDATGMIGKIGGEHGQFVTAGIYFLPKSIFAFATRARAAGFSALRQFLAGLVNWKVRLHAVELSEAVDVDVPHDLETARAMIDAGGAAARGRGGSSR
jgi:choline kinase